MEIDGPQVLLPGSDFFVLGLVRLLFLVGLIALVVAVVVRLVRRRRARRRGAVAEPLGRPVGIMVCSAITVVGLVLSIVIGMGTAIAMSQAKWIERSLYPYAVVLQTIPVLAIVPLIGFTLGYDFSSRVLVVVLIALFPIITNTLFGLLSVDQGHHDLFSLHRGGRVTRLFKLQLPAAMPAIFTGLRIAAGASVIGAVVGDFFFQQGTPGIGVLMNTYASELESERLYAAVILSSLLGIVVFLAVTWLERRVVGRWHTSTRGTR